MNTYNYCTPVYLRLDKIMASQDYAFHVLFFATRVFLAHFFATKLLLLGK